MPEFAVYRRKERVNGLLTKTPFATLISNSPGAVRDTVTSRDWIGPAATSRVSKRPRMVRLHGQYPIVCIELLSLFSGTVDRVRFHITLVDTNTYCSDP